MFPIQAVNDPQDVLATDLLGLGNSCRRFASSAASPDLKNVCFCENGSPVPLSFWFAWAWWGVTLGSMLYGVLEVGLFGIPAKVCQGAIGWVAVGEVASFHPFGTGADEGKEHKPVNGLLHFSKLGAKVSCAGMDYFCETVPVFSGDAATSVTIAATPHGAVVANTVTGEAWNAAVGDARITFSHDVNLLERFAFGQGHAGRNRLRAARPILATGQEGGHP